MNHFTKVQDCLTAWEASPSAAAFLFSQGTKKRKGRKCEERKEVTAPKPNEKVFSPVSFPSTLHCHSLFTSQRSHGL